MARRDLARDLGRAPVHLERRVRKVVLGENERKRAERRGFDRIDSNSERLVVHLRDEIGPGEHEVLVATFERLAAEVVRPEILGLHPRAERAVEDEHAFEECIEKRVARAATDSAECSTRIGHPNRLGETSPAPVLHLI